jgi:hypothetical protein
MNVLFLTPAFSHAFQQLMPDSMFARTASASFARSGLPDLVGLFAIIPSFH